MSIDKKPKNIIVSTHDSLYPIKGGGGLRTLKAAEEFKIRGHKVMIIAPTEGVGELSGIKVHWLHAPKKQRSQILSTIKFNIRLLRKFLQFISQTDVLFIHNTIAAVFVPFLKKIFKFKFVLDITDIHAEYLSSGKRNGYERILTPLILWYEYFIIRSADSIITVTNAMKALLVSKGIDPDKIEIVYDGTDVENMPKDKRNNAEQGVIHLGTIDHQHGVELLVRTIPIVIKDAPQTKFYFVGGGRELPNIKKLASELKIENRCVFTDYLPCEEAIRYLEMVSIGIVPRKDCLANRIVTTLKLYEYWASATAIVCTRLEGVEEIASDSEDILFFESGNVNELAQKILILLKDNETRERLIKNGLIKVKCFDWKNMIKKIVDYSLTERYLNV